VRVDEFTCIFFSVCEGERERERESERERATKE